MSLEGLSKGGTEPMTLPENESSLVGCKWVYSFSRWKAKELIPAKGGIGIQTVRKETGRRRSAAVPTRRYRAIVVHGIYLRYRRSVAQGGPQRCTARGGGRVGRRRIRRIGLVGHFGGDWFEHLRRYLSRFA